MNEFEAVGTAKYQEKLSRSEIEILPSLGAELFFVGQKESGDLPIDIETNREAINFAEERRNLHYLFQEVFDAITDPRVDVSKAIENGLIDKAKIRALWEGISDFLEKDENNSRLLLYLPFEILPNFADPNPHCDDLLRTSGQRLKSIYRQAWIRLLHEDEPRANFVDGDVLEPGLGEPERISKAGHLVPELLKRGIIDNKDVITLLNLISHKKYLIALAEGIIVAHGQGLVDDLIWQRARMFLGNKSEFQQFENSPEKKYQDPDSGLISPERVKWLWKVIQETKDRARAKELSHQLVKGLDIKSFLKEYGLNRSTVLAIMEAGELLKKGDSQKAVEFSVQVENIIKDLVVLNEAEFKNIIIGGLNRWVRIGIVDTSYLAKYGIKLVDLALPTQFDKENTPEEFGPLKIVIKKIEEHPELSKYLYPVLLIFGSRQKGYADLDADIDTAIFFRPDVKLEERNKILETLKRDIPETSIIDKILESWVRREDGELHFVEPQQNTRIFIGENHIHFFMGGVWIGRGEELLLIRSELLGSYLDLSRYQDNKEAKRRQLLGQLELDTLQYRLMHKGYRKYYPNFKREDCGGLDLIDWESDYWDSGYRRIATLLFISRVFLPDLSTRKTGENAGR